MARVNSWPDVRLFVQNACQSLVPTGTSNEFETDRARYIQAPSLSRSLNLLALTVPKSRNQPDLPHDPAFGS